MDGAYPQTFFAGANTADGFCAAYPSLLREQELDRLYIIKGGSGTGKSSVIKACAAAAAKAGADVKMFLCSSDPSSADAVILSGKNGRRVAIADGTAPHTRDPEIPGAVGEIVDVGQYWDDTALAARREEIILLQEQKAEAYTRTYRYLRAYRSMTDSIRDMTAACLLREKMESCARRIASPWKRCPSPTVQKQYTYALAMTGPWHLRTLSRAAGAEYRILDTYGCGEFFLAEMRRAAASRECSLLYAPLPPCADSIGELYFPDTGTIFTPAEEREAKKSGVRYINMQRFLDREKLSRYRSRLRFCVRCRESVLDGALDALRDAQTAHFALEKLYGSAMDFSTVQEKSIRLAEEILTRLFP